MHAQGPAESTDRHEDVGEIWMLTEQFGELVDDDEQRWQRAQLSSGPPGALVSGDPVEVARRAKDFLAAVYFTGQGITHSTDQCRLVRQVRDDGRHVRRRL